MGIADLGGRVVPVGSVLLVVAACQGGPGGKQAALPVERDSAGISIVSHSPRVLSQLPTWSVGEEPALVLGSDEWRAPTNLHRVTGAVRLDDGGIAVANGGSSEVRFFGPSGELVGVVGDTAEGGIAFQALLGLHRVAGDTLLAYDAVAARMTVLTSRGEVVRTVRVRDEEGPLLVVAVAPDGFMLAGRASRLDHRSLKPGFTRQSTFLSVADPMGAVRAALGSFPAAELAVMDMGDTMRPEPTPFTRHTYYGMQRDAVVIASQKAAEYRVYDRGGELRRIVQLPTRPVRFTAGHLDALIGRATAGMSSLAAADLRARLEQLPAPETVPHHGPLVVDREDYVWLSDFPDPGTGHADWTVYDPEGHAVARLTLPPDFRPLDIGQDYVLGLRPDDQGVQFLWLLNLDRSAPAAPGSS